MANGQWIMTTFDIKDHILGFFEHKFSKQETDTPYLPGDGFNRLDDLCGKPNQIILFG